MDGWRSQYILLRLNEAEQKLAKPGLLTVLFNIHNRVILRDSNQVCTAVVFQLSPSSVGLSSAVLILLSKQVSGMSVI